MKKNKKNYNHDNKGITLALLVVTIVVMLIITGVTVSITTHDNVIGEIKEKGEIVKSDIEQATNQIIKEEQGSDIATGEIKTVIINNVELKLEAITRSKAAVKLDFTGYMQANGKEIEKILYTYEVEGPSSESEPKTGDTDISFAYIFEDLQPGTKYIFNAYAQYKEDKEDSPKELLASVEGETQKWNFELGDYVDYDAGVWTQAEIDNLEANNLYHADYQDILDNLDSSTGLIPTTVGTLNKYSGMTVGSDKNVGVSTVTTGFSGSNSSLSSFQSSPTQTRNVGFKHGWRILAVDGDTITIVSAGMPEYYISRAIYASMFRADSNNPTVLSFYAEEAAMQGIANRNFNQYINSTYADSAHMMTYNEVETAEKIVTTLAQTGGAYIVSTVIYNEHNPRYYTIESALRNKIYGSNKIGTWIGFYYTSFSNGAFYSAGTLGVRIVVKLKSNVSISTTNAEGETVDGKSWTSPLHLVVNK